MDGMMMGTESTKDNMGGVERALTSLMDELERLENYTEGIRQRFGHAMRPEQDTVEKSVNSEIARSIAAPQSEVAESLRSQTSRISQVNRRLADYLDRCDL